MEEEVLTEEETSEEMERITALLSPEAAVMLSVAIVLDIAGIIFTILDLLFGIGEIFSWISDGIGIAIFGLWLLMRPKRVTKTKEVVARVAERRRTISRAVEAIKKMGRGTRFAISVVGEVLPLVGTLPFWTWMVWSELKS
jgi:hypothetical protein